MKTAGLVFDWLVKKMEALDRSRDGKLQRLLETRLLEPIIRIGLNANFLTGIRALIAAALIAFFTDNISLRHNPDFPSDVRLWLFGALLAAFATDALDGPLARLARRRGLEDDGRGAHTDPFVDKLLTLPVLAYYLPAISAAGKTLTLMTIFGDIMAIWIRSLAAKKGIHIPSNIFGKYKMAFICCAISSLVLWFPASEEVFLIFLTVSLTCGTISVIKHALKLAEHKP